MRLITLSIKIVATFLLTRSSLRSNRVLALNTNVPSPGQKGPFLWDLNEEASSQGSSGLSLHNDHATHEITSKLNNIERGVEHRLSGSKRPRNLDSDPTEQSAWGAKKARDAIKRPRKDLTSFKYMAGFAEATQKVSSVDHLKPFSKQNTVSIH
ncbi:uncharacterized protein FA14DRAFT_156250 [Meira miltonrushii]|uniref:Uncharacterized protein n=1 Tax=Meira miltonrushii TaxID=1280837 RepID=A0A316V7G6_9BASI|nr:uncharacterized protein FA14DRAFT_156250 [Meira miltonrushii]PWN33559.1 hypothetical protein FA14DRAFT_156250 [Meira miltonrushii]